MRDVLQPEPGTYIFILKVKTGRKIEIGKLVEFTFKKGYYIYIGSAHGPGGIKARIKRHLKKNKVKHWHIDYLRDAGSAVAVLISYSKKKKECEWASNLSSTSRFSTPVNGFGSSDCPCPSHLFYSKNLSDIDILKNTIKDHVELLINPFLSGPDIVESSPKRLQFLHFFT